VLAIGSFSGVMVVSAAEFPATLGEARPASSGPPGSCAPSFL